MLIHSAKYSNNLLPNFFGMNLDSREDFTLESGKSSKPDQLKNKSRITNLKHCQPTYCHIFINAQKFDSTPFNILVKTERFRN